MQKGDTVYFVVSSHTQGSFGIETLSSAETLSTSLLDSVSLEK